MTRHRSWPFTALLTLLLATGCGGKDSDDDADEDVTEEPGEDTEEVAGEPEDEAECATDGDCDDEDPCSTDTCDTEDGVCLHVPVDADEDGYPAAEVDSTSCDGTDCDDEDENVNPGVTITCLDQDRDCNGFDDSDNDDDGYRSHALCPDGDDCNDADAAVYLGECSGVNDCCDGCVQINGCWMDDVTGCAWEDPPRGGTRNWDDSSAYCSALVLAGRGAGEWSMPTIEQLRSLVRGCAATEIGGACTVSDTCGDSSCNVDCDGCTASAGPGTGGCYWDALLEGSCSSYWSSTEWSSGTDAWSLGFTTAAVAGSSKTTSPDVSIRCVSCGS
jgi:hypothetical protein